MSLLALAASGPAMYAVTLAALSRSYHQYLERGIGRNGATLRLLLPLYLAAALGLSSLILSLAFPVSLACLAAITIPQLLRRGKCTVVGTGTASGIRYLVCKSDEAYAGYSPATGEVYVSTALRRILDEEELSAVLHHEAGHAAQRAWILRGEVLSALWLWAIVTDSLLLTLAVAGSRGLAPAIAAALLIASAAATMTLVVTLWRWLGEHEADAYAARATSPEALASALIKTAIYRRLGSYTRYVDSISLRGECEVEPAGLRRVALTLLRHSLDIPLWVGDLLRKTPRCKTHPPLELRLLALARLSPAEESPAATKEQTAT